MLCSQRFKMLVAAILVAGSLGGAALAQPGPGGRRLAPPAYPLMTALDTDGNSELSAEEIAAASQSLRKLDRNNDGKLSAEEVLPRFGPARPGRRPGVSRPGRETVSFEAAPQPKDDAEKKILDVLADMHANQSRGMMNVPPEDGQLLRLLTEAMGAKHVVEIGTSNGYSGIWFCLALRTTGGKLTTYEIDKHRASLARDNFKRASVDGMVTLVEGDAHQEVTKLKDPIDLLFLDADKEGYIDYLNKLLPLVRPGGLIVAHNMNVRQADPRYVKAITTRPDLETIFLHMEGAGVGVTMKKRPAAEATKAP